MGRSVNAEESIFSLEKVDVTYSGTRGQRPVLHDVSFTLAAGQRAGLYGPNGSGKTTLFRCLTGLVRPGKGLVRFHGKALDDEKDFHALRCKVGFVLQHAEDQLFFPTVLEDVAFGPLNLGLSAAGRELDLSQRVYDFIHDIADEVRTDAGTFTANQMMERFLFPGDLQSVPIGRLSGGERRRLYLLSVLMEAPNVLLLDEPTNDLDQEARQRLIDILCDLPTARMVISHDWDFLSRVCGEYWTIREGRLLSCAPDVRHSHEHVHPLGGEPHWHLPITD